MIVEIDDVCLANVWEESFNDRETGQPVNFYRALVTSTGEPPAQFAVSKDNFETLAGQVGTVGTATVSIDAQPGRRVRVSLVGID